MAERLTDTAEGIEAEYPKLIADVVLDMMNAGDINGAVARVMYRVLTSDEPVDLDELR